MAMINKIFIKFVYCGRTMNYVIDNLLDSVYLNLNYFLGR